MAPYLLIPGHWQINNGHTYATLATRLDVANE